MKDERVKEMKGRGRESEERMEERVRKRGREGW